VKWRPGRTRAKIGPPPDRESEAAIRVSKRGTVALNLAGLNLKLKSGWHSKAGRIIKWVFLGAGGAGALETIRRLWS